MEKQEFKVKSLYKCLQILECFSVERPEVGISEIAKDLELTKSNVHNIVSTLVVAGYLEKRYPSEKYALTNKLLEFSYIITHQLSYQSVVQSTMQKLSQKVKGVVYFGVLHEAYVLYMFATLPSREDKRLAIRSIMGEKAPLYCTSIGKALLMTLEKEEVLRRVKLVERKKYTANTLVTDQDLLDDLEKSKYRGYAEDNIEHELSIRCVGVPVFTHRGDLIGALSVSGLSVNSSSKEIEEVAKELQAAAAEIRMQL